jgi:F-type H+-transporting ATPase subunit b
MSLILAAEGGKFNPLAPEPGLFIWTTIAFIAVLFLLAKKVFPKLQETLADREQKIKADLEQAEKTRAEADRVLEDYKARVAQAREETSRMIDEARQSADSVRKDLIAKAEEDARGIVERARKQLDTERDRALSELHSQLAEWSTAIAARIVDKQLDPQSHKDLVDQFIKQIEQEAAER